MIGNRWRWCLPLFRHSQKPPSTIQVQRRKGWIMADNLPHVHPILVSVTILPCRRLQRTHSSQMLEHIMLHTTSQWFHQWSLGTTSAFLLLHSEIIVCKTWRMSPVPCRNSIDLIIVSLRSKTMSQGLCRNKAQSKRVQIGRIDTNSNFAHWDMVPQDFLSLE